MNIKRGLVLLALLFGSIQVQAADPEPMHSAADHSFLDRKTNVLNLTGNAYVSRNNEELHADHIRVFLNTDDVEAKGRITYQYGSYLIRADAIEFNTKTKTGRVHNGNLTNGKLALRGETMNLVSQDHIIVSQYDYTTCIDCPNSWAMTGREADLTFEEYVYIKDFIFKVKDASLVWFPYMIFPVKTKRQSGVISPKFGINETNGPYFVLPYFWATNRWSDMTFGLGDYGRRGPRIEWEGEYKLTQRSEGKFNFFWTKDDELRPDLKARAAGRVLLNQELPFGFEGKLRLNEVSDSGYPIEFADDIPGHMEPVLTSELFFSRNDPTLSSTLSFKRIRNLLYFSDTPTLTNPNGYRSGFDPGTVQELPRIVINSNNQFLFGSKVAAGVEARFNRFIRSSGPIDDVLSADGKTSYETIREANRVTLIPNLYTTLNPFPWLSVVPSVQYRSFFYNFNSVANYSNLARGYLLTQADASFQIERVFQSEDGGPSYKHTFRPQLTYSIIPTIQQPAHHPFIDLIQSSGGTGKYFDNSDIVPLGASQNLDSYFTPLGHSLSYGFVTQLYRKRANAIPEPAETPSPFVEATKDQETEKPKEKNVPVSPGYETSRLVEFSALQTWDIRETQYPGPDKPELSPLFTHLIYTEKKFQWDTSYTYYFYLDKYPLANLDPNASPHQVSSTLSWTFEKAMRNNGTTIFDRSVDLNYQFSHLSSRVSSVGMGVRFSINDYLMPTATVAYNLVSPDHKLAYSKFGLLYQSPSQCWRVEGDLTRAVDTGTGINFSFSLNLAGNGNVGL